MIGNVAYALGIGRGLLGVFRQFTGGEVKEYSEIYNHTRHLALQRLEQEARERGANAVVDIITRIKPFGPGVSEMLMVGTPTVKEPADKQSAIACVARHCLIFAYSSRFLG